MTELRFNNSFITHTPGSDEPFELVIYKGCGGNQQLSAIEAKEIADFIYENLAIPKTLMTDKK
jgi:hypothetical protein